MNNTYFGCTKNFLYSLFSFSYKFISDFPNNYRNLKYSLNFWIEETQTTLPRFEEGVTEAKYREMRSHKEITAHIRFGYCQNCGGQIHPSSMWNAPLPGPCPSGVSYTLYSVSPMTFYMDCFSHLTWPHPPWMSPPPTFNIPSILLKFDFLN